MNQILLKINDFKKDFDNEIQEYLKKLRRTVDSDILYSSIDYALNSTGKRLRPFLVYQIYNMKKSIVRFEDISKFALALEIIHTYTLIHDDMPCIDNDELRHGKLTQHKKFGEGVAMLTGDALLAEGARVLSSMSLTRRSFLAQRCALENVGLKIVDGQVQDFRNEPLNLKALLEIYSLKTSKLFVAAIKGTAILLNFSKKNVEKLEEYAEAIGILFQISDDIISKNQSSSETGKSEKLLEEQKRVNIYDFVKEEDIKFLINDYRNKALNAIEHFKNAQNLRDLVEYVISRTK